MSTSQDTQVLTIDEQLEVWHTNTPVWNSFPAPDQTAVYVLGWSEESIAALDQSDDQPSGVILVFNSRRQTVRAYRHNDRNARRIHGLGLSDYGYVLNPNVSKFAYCDGSPRGERIPNHYAFVFAKYGTAVCHSGVWGYLSEKMNAPQIEIDWFERVYNAMRRESFQTQYYGEIYQMRFTPSPDIGASVNWFGLGSEQIAPPNLEQIPYDFDRVWDVMPESISAPLFNTAQYGELYCQMVYWQDRFDSAWLKGDLDDCEFCSLFVATVGGLMNL